MKTQSASSLACERDDFYKIVWQTFCITFIWLAFTFFWFHFFFPIDASSLVFIRFLESLLAPLLTFFILLLLYLFSLFPVFVR
jgi:hypothetical protein